MVSIVSQYLKKRGMPRPILGPVPGLNPGAVRSAVVIPAMQEMDDLPRLLADLAASPADCLSGHLTLIVVNNPAEASPACRRDNQALLSWLATGGRNLLPNLGWIDAASPGRELPGGGGVGLARRTGCDSLLHMLTLDAASEMSTDLVLAHLDADCRLEPTYLQALQQAPGGQRAYVLDLKHQPAETPEAQTAIDAYEKYLDYMVNGLTWAGSPYAYPTVGSAMASTVQTYVRAGGIPHKRKAGEDFYFLQACAKVGTICRLTGTCVHPSPRISHRVPFGTGPRMAEALQKGEPEMAPDPAAFAELKNLLRDMERAVKNRPSMITPSLPEWFADTDYGKKIDAVWKKLLGQCKSADHLRRELARWFDALATIRLIRGRGERLRKPLPINDAWKKLQQIINDNGQRTTDN